jgi:hypothetical protein
MTTITEDTLARASGQMEEARRTLRAAETRLIEQQTRLEELEMALQMMAAALEHWMTIFIIRGDIEIASRMKREANLARLVLSNNKIPRPTRAQAAALCRSIVAIETGDRKA